LTRKPQELQVFEVGSGETKFVTEIPSKCIAVNDMYRATRLTVGDLPSRLRRSTERDDQAMADAGTIHRVSKLLDVPALEIPRLLFDLNENPDRTLDG